MRVVVQSERIAQPVGPFSPAVRGPGVLYVSGQVAQDPVTGRLVPGGVVEQTARVLENVAAILESAGLTFNHVLRVGVYLTDMRDFAAVNEVYGRYFKAPYPARTTIGVRELPLGATVEVDVVAGDAAGPSDGRPPASR